MKQGVKTSTEAKSQALQPLRIFISKANLAKETGISAEFSAKRQKHRPGKQYNNNKQLLNFEMAM